MQNFELHSGVFIGRVVDDGGAILDVPYKDLDCDLKDRIKSHVIRDENIIRELDLMAVAPLNLDNEINQLNLIEGLSY